MAAPKKTTAAPASKPAKAPEAAPASKPAKAPEAAPAPTGAKASGVFWYYDPADLRIMGGPGPNDPQPKTKEDHYLVDDDSSRLKPDEEMIASIDQDGVRKMIVVVIHNGEPFVKDGRRRVVNARAVNERRAAGKKPRPALQIKAEVDTAGVSEQTLLDSFALNTMSREHNWLSQARKIQALLDTGMNKLAIHRAIGMTRGTMDNRLELLKLSPAIQREIDNGKITPSAAAHLAALPDHDAQWNAFIKIMEEAGDKSYGQQTAAKEAVAAAQAEGGGEGSGDTAKEDKPKAIPLTVQRKMLVNERIKNLFPREVAMLQVLAGDKYPKDVKDVNPEFVELLHVALGIPLTPPRKGEDADKPATGDAPAAVEPSDDAPVMNEI